MTDSARTALVQEYTYTGNPKKDLRALGNLVEKCVQASKTLDRECCQPCGAAGWERWLVRMELGLTKDALSAEIESLTSREFASSYQNSFLDEWYERPRRPKGARWTFVRSVPTI